MTTKEAIQAMLDGKKVQCLRWETYEYIELSPCFNFIDEHRDYYKIEPDDTEWKIYEEPKPKQTVTIEKWLFEDRFGIKFIQDIERDCVLCYCHEFQTTKVRLLDTYEVEL